MKKKRNVKVYSFNQCAKFFLQQTSTEELNKG